MNKHLYLSVAGCVVVGLHAMAADPNADNSGKNTRDTQSQSLTPIDQSNAPADIKITAHIRKAVIAQKDFSVDAHNVKIITVDSVVTLRGPVDSDAEKMKIEELAKQSGASKVVTEIEVKASK